MLDPQIFQANWIDRQLFTPPANFLQMSFSDRATTHFLFQFPFRDGGQQDFEWHPGSAFGDGDGDVDGDGIGGDASDGGSMSFISESHRSATTASEIATPTPTTTTAIATATHKFKCRAHFQHYRTDTITPAITDGISSDISNTSEDLTLHKNWKNCNNKNKVGTSIHMHTYIFITL